MKNFFVGVKPGVGPVLKIMRDDADDPLTTPNNQHGKYLFNSEIQKLGYIDRIMVVEPDWDAYPGGDDSILFYTLPVGATGEDVEIVIRSEVDTFGTGAGRRWQSWAFTKKFFGKDFLPLVEVRVPKSDGSFDGPNVIIYQSDVPPYVGWGVVSGSNGNNSSGFVWSFDRSINQWINHGPGYHVAMFTNFNPDIQQKSLVTVFNLPADQTPLPDYATEPTGGQEVIRIDGGGGGMARVSVPGHTVYDPDPEKFILHEEKIPIKILAAGEITIAASSSGSIQLPIEVPDTAYMDYHVKRADDPAFWAPPYLNIFTGPLSPLSFTYKPNGDKIDITNQAEVAITIRYIVCAHDSTGYTSGGSKIVVVDEEEGFIQVKRPGSSDADPSLNDVMIDTRFSYLPILAEGFLSYPDDFPTVMTGTNLCKGERMATIALENPSGMMPFVKCGAVFEGLGVYPQTNIVSTNFLDPITSYGVHHIRISSDGWNGRVSAPSTAAEIVSNTQVNLYAGNNNPHYYLGGSMDTYQSTMLGLRYYIFGIPLSL